MSGSTERCPRSGVRRRAALAGMAVALAFAAGAGSAQQWPAKPVRLIVPFPAGGNTDLVARAFSTRFAETFGQQFVIDNRGGANTIVGAELAARAAPDGHTLFLTTATTMTNNVVLYRKLPYDPKTAFALISMAVVFPYVIAVHPSVPARSVKELVALSKAQPGRLAYGTSGSGSSGHIAGALFETMAGVRWTHIPYKGSAGATMDAIGGQIPMVITGIASIAGQAQGGKLRVLGVCSEKRLTHWPDIPTIAESGYPGYVGITWFGFVAPAGTPKPVIDRVQGEVVRVGALPDVRERLQSQGFELMTGTPEQFADFIAKELARVTKVVDAAGIRIE